eukprot:Gregarina_sp_Poly_1__1403@NODE_1349_length_4315_cov_87_969868_g905_i0_p4_GENE_NODE_1349_length_4315_cov_87_969868_g905_i0NODE_1349_length_4315_cov_87_969868_g905_i0_p4_ORF_typecomplete_len180_score27_27_NODE_1349_length_4315_cov_87_969868_g905_i011601699
MLPLQRKARPIVQLTFWTAIGLLTIVSLLSGALRTAKIRTQHKLLYVDEDILKNANNSLVEVDLLQRGIALAAPLLMSQVSEQAANALVNFYSVRRPPVVPTLDAFEFKSWNLTVHYMKEMYYRQMAEIDAPALWTETNLPHSMLAHIDISQSYLAFVILFVSLIAFLIQYMRNERSSQ